MRFYRLVGDVHIPSQWQLDDVKMSDGAEVNLLTGTRLSLAGTLHADVLGKGRELAFSEAGIGAPVATRALASAMAEVAGSDLEILPLRLGGRDGYSALNATRSIRCLDEQRSGFMKFTDDDEIAPDKIGRYRAVGPMFVDPGSIPGGAHFFRMWGWSIALIVSERIKEAMERVGCLGAEFLPVS